jgi:hypothetical protein
MTSSKGAAGGGGEGFAGVSMENVCETVAGSPLHPFEHVPASASAVIVNENVVPSGKSVTVHPFPVFTIVIPGGTGVVFNVKLKFCTQVYMVDPYTRVMSTVPAGMVLKEKRVLLSFWMNGWRVGLDTADVAPMAVFRDVVVEAVQRPLIPNTYVVFGVRFCTRSSLTVFPKFPEFTMMEPIDICQR